MKAPSESARHTERVSQTATHADGPGKWGQCDV